MYQPRQILAYGTLSIFLVFVLFYGIADSLSHMYSSSGTRSIWGVPSSPKQFNEGSNLRTPPGIAPPSNLARLQSYEQLNTLTSDQFPLVYDPTRRIIIVGDIHGMIKPFQKLLEHLKYNPSKDVLMHVGDITTKGSHEGSLAVLHFMASNNITGVRGNHDQKVTEWRGWLDGLNFCADRGQEWFKRIPEGWVLFSDHYQVAKDMSVEDFRYLLKLPIRLYVPSAHVFIVHAGLLPSNPKYEIDDEQNQPLAHIPAFPSHSHKLEQSRKTTEGLRNLQEIGLLMEIPQNADPWVVLNMRSIVGDTVSKKSKEGKPWSKVWKQHMKSCVGFRNELAGDDNPNNTASKKGKEVALPCYPSTTIYGHAASRGLDIKRWSFGLDSGCVYNKTLSALVLGGPANKQMRRASVNTQRDDAKEASSDDDDTDLYSSSSKSNWVPFGDKGRARIVAVKCQQ
ncbi:Metallo-dependent phosphatase-like protein [Flammula alnicola]|nr:Metallo-dependent phosphatase-like protein [Flammula alnicola]